MSASDAAVTVPASAPGMSTRAIVAQSSWYTVWMTAIVAVMSQIDRGVLALFVQPIKRDYHLSDTQVSFLLGFAFTIFYVVGGPPISRMADRGVRKSVIAGCLAVWSLATGLCGLAQGFWGFFASRAVIGASEAGCGPASISMIADAVQKEKLPRAYALYNAGFVGGTALSMVFGGILLGLLSGVPPIAVPGIGHIYNWQLVFFLLAVPGLLIAAVMYLTVTEPQRKGGTKPEGYSIGEVLAFVRSQKQFHLPLIIGVLGLAFQNYGLIAWMPAFYERTYGWGPEMVGPITGFTSLITATIGLFGGARLAEIFGRTRDDANLRTLFLAMLLPIPLFVAAPLMPNPWLAVILNGVAGIFFTMGGAGYVAALNLASPNEMRSQINAMYFILQNAIAGSLAPTFVALATDYIAHSENDLRYVLSAFRLILGPITAYAVWRSLKPYARIYREKADAGLLG